MLRLEFVRSLTSEESRRTAFDIYAQLDKALIVDEALEFDEELEDENSSVLAGELSFSILDTFQEGFLRVLDHRPIGLQTYGGYNNGKNILDKDKNFSLYTLLFSGDVANYLKSGAMLPNVVKVIYYLDGVEKGKYVITPEATEYDEEFLYGATELGEYLKDSRDFYRYDAAEKIIKFICIDENHDKLTKTSVSGGVVGTSALGGPVLDETTAAYMTWPGTRPDVYNFLPHWASGWQTSTVDRLVNAAWVGMAVPSMMKALYDRAFGLQAWTHFVELCTWKFQCAGIASNSFGEYDAGQNGYRPYLNRREQVENPPSHIETNKFALLAPAVDLVDPTTQQAVYLDGSFSYDPNLLNADLTDIAEKNYSFCHYESAWDVVTRLANSFGYYTRFSWKNGKPLVQHIMRRRDPKLVKLPPFLDGGSHCTPHVLDADSVECEPYGEWGEVCPARRSNVGNGWDATPENTTCRWSKYMKAVEPQFDRTNVQLVWDTGDFDYFNQDNLKVETNEPKYNHIHQPKPDVTVEHKFTAKSVFGAFGNFMLLVFGGYDGGDSDSKPDVFQSPEFVFVLAGSTTEGKLPRGNGATDLRYWSAHPNLILAAGYSVDGGKTVTPTVGAVNEKYYRGLGTVSVPYGDPVNGVYTYISTHSALEANAIFMAQFKCSYGERRSLQLPFTSNFENEYGEKGWDAIYPGLGIHIYNKRFLITRRKFITGRKARTEIDVREIPPLPPAITATTGRFKIENSRNVWQFGSHLDWVGAGGKPAEEEFSNMH